MKKNSGYILVFVLTALVSYLIFSESKTDYVGYKGSTYYSSNSKQAHMILNRALSEESHIAWSTGNHTASPVPTGAVGPRKYTDQLNGLIQNTDIAKVSQKAIEEGINVIIVIGDGMGMNHMTMPIFMRMAEKSDEGTYFEKILNEGSCGITLTNPVNGLVTGSAAAATAIATGQKSYMEVVSVDTNGYPLKTSLELAEEKGFSTAIITDAGITDGTPAGFYAHMYNRDLENEIAEQLVHSKIDIIFGGGAKRFIPKNTKLSDYKYFKDRKLFNNDESVRNDNKNLLYEFIDLGYDIISSENELLNLSNKTEKVLGLFNSGGLSAAIDRDIEVTGEPSLGLLTEKAFDILNNKNKNYFAMIEAGRIDWEAHDNDAGAVYFAVEEMNDILKLCYDEYNKNRNKTLLIFTADHETGGLSFSYTKRTENNKFVKKLKSGDEWFSKTDPLLFEEFKKLKSQKQAIHKGFGKIKSINELYEWLNYNLGYNVTQEDAEAIFNTRKGYVKGK